MTGLRDSRGGEVVKFIEKFCVHGEGDMEGMPALLRDDQKLLAYRWFEIDGGHNWWYERMYYEAPKGDGKTQLFAWFDIASLFLHERWFGSRANIKVGARSRLQAGQLKGGDAGDGIFGRIAQVLELSPALKGRVDILEDRVTVKGSKSRLVLVPARASTSDGGLPTDYTADEVQDWAGEAAEAHQRNENSTTKRRDGRAKSCSTPGSRVGDPTVGWRLHEYGSKIATGTIDDDRFLFVSHSASLEHDLTETDPVKLGTVLRAALVEANPGIDDRKLERLCRRFNEIPLEDFERFHLGRWVQQTAFSWLADRPGAWARCQDSGLAVQPGGRVWLGVDASHSNDSTSVNYVGLVGDRWVSRCRVFEQGPNGIIDHSEVRQHVRDLAAMFDVQGVSYDPAFFEQSAADLADEGLPMVNAPQSPQRMVPKCSMAWELIVSGLVAHDGDEVFARHVNGAAKRHYRFGWSLSKAKSDELIDACIAFVLAVHLAVTTYDVAATAEPWIMVD